MFRSLSGKAGGKGFGLLEMEPNFDLPLPLFCLFFHGSPTPRLHVSDWQANKSPEPMASYCYHQRGEEKNQEPTFDWAANKNYDLVSHISGRGQKLHPIFLLVSESIRLNYFIMAFCHAFSGKTVKFQSLLLKISTEIVPWVYDDAVVSHERRRTTLYFNATACHATFCLVWFGFFV